MHLNCCCYLVPEYYYRIVMFGRITLVALSRPSSFRRVTTTDSRVKFSFADIASTIRPGKIFPGATSVDIMVSLVCKTNCSGGFDIDTYVLVAIE